MADTAALKAQLATLESVLTALDATRSSLPALLRSFSLPATSQTQRAAIYRDYSNQASTSITSLSEALQSASALLSQAEASEAADGSEGVVVRPRERQDEGWARLSQLMNGKMDDAKGKRRATEFENVVLPREGPRDVSQLEEQLSRWAQGKRKVSAVKVAEDGRELRLEVKALMKAVLILRWFTPPPPPKGDVKMEDEDGDANGAQDDGAAAEGGRRMCQVERVACFGLKEDRSAYQQSQHSLHQSLTNQAMALIESSRQRPTYSSQSNLEEVLTFLVDPPLPF